MNLQFQHHTGDPNAFFKLLPLDWQDSLPDLGHKNDQAKIYVLHDQGEIIAGGIVSKGIPPDMRHFEKEAGSWANKGYLYIGHLWVVEHRRNEKLGSLWLNELKKYHPKQHFWLTIEEEPLKDFYLRNHFRLVKELKKGDAHEWLLVWDGHKK